MLRTMKQTLHLYNTRSRKLEPFSVPSPDHQVGLYLCGPTVYGAPHLGHGRSAVTFDLLVRYLRHLGYRVRSIRNITDVGHMTQETDGSGEDKVLKQAKKESRSPMEVAHHYTERYREDMRQLNVLPPSIEPTATGHIPEQIAFIEKLLREGHAYAVHGSVYFDVPRYERSHPYGVLARRKIEELRPGARPLIGSDEKRHPADFALWKRAPKEHIMGWPSPWGRGYPGWHAECAAMSTKYLTLPIDIHGGGSDLALHHDCERAQVQAHSGVPLARFWLHHNLVTVADQKMSKSAENAISLQACFAGAHPLLSRPYPPMVIRFFLLHAHYRRPLHFAEASLHQAAKSYEKLINGYKIALEKKTTKMAAQASPTPYAAEVRAACRACYAAMNNDLNTPQLISALSTLLGYLSASDHRAPLPSPVWEELLTTYILFVRDLLGLQPPSLSHGLLQALLHQYKRAKATQQYDEVDAIRAALDGEGIALQDKGQEVTWRYKII